MVVPATSPHINVRGERMNHMGKVAELLQRPRHYAMVRKVGNSTVRIIQPAPITDAERERILDAFYVAGWAIVEEVVERGESV